jgi:hypothetical protein
MFLPVRVRSLDKKPCLRFTTRSVALFVGLLDLWRAWSSDDVTVGNAEAGEGLMEGDWNIREHELPLASGLEEIERWYDLEHDGGRLSEH